MIRTKTCRDEVVERICNCIEGLSNEDLASLYNREFSNSDMTYVGNDEFEEVEENDEESS